MGETPIIRVPSFDAYCVAPVRVVRPGFRNGSMSWAAPAARIERPSCPPIVIVSSDIDAWLSVRTSRPSTNPSASSSS